MNFTIRFRRQIAWIRDHARAVWARLTAPVNCGRKARQQQKRLAAQLARLEEHRRLASLAEWRNAENNKSWFSRPPRDRY